MDVRHLTAYVVIAGIIAALFAVGMLIRRKRERHRQMMKGRRVRD